MKTTSVGIVGAAGFTGSELIRLAINHSMIELIWVQSVSKAGKAVVAHLPDLLGQTQLKFVAQIPSFDGVEVVFLCLAHGESQKWLNLNPLPKGIKIIDLSQDFRNDPKSNFVYGLTELNKSKISVADRIANPGCFATCIQLALMPAIAFITSETQVHITAITGSTGAGQKSDPTTHFSWRTQNLSAYKVFEHQHEREIGQHLFQSRPPEIFFTPTRGPFTRGIFAHLYFQPYGFDPKDVVEHYQTFFKDSAFTFVTENEVDLKQVINTNLCLIQARIVKNRVCIVAVLDNLLKGASGQALENFNLMQGYPQDLGLRLKASGW